MQEIPVAVGCKIGGIAAQGTWQKYAHQMLSVSRNSMDKMHAEAETNISGTPPEEPLVMRARTFSSLLPPTDVHTIQLTCFVESLQVEMGPSGCSDSTLSGEACQLRTCRCWSMNSTFATAETASTASSCGWHRCGIRFPVLWDPDAL